MSQRLLTAVVSLALVGFAATMPGVASAGLARRPRTGLATRPTNWPDRTVWRLPTKRGHPSPEAQGGERWTSGCAFSRASGLVS